MEKPLITKSKNYRGYLKAIIAFQHEQNQKFSMIYFSQKMNLSAAYLKQVLSGRRNLSLDHAFKLATLLKLETLERAILFMMIAKEDHTHPGIKAFFDNLLTVYKRDLLHYQSDPNFITIFGSSLMWELFSLIGTENFSSDPDWIAKKLLAKNVGKSQIESALRRLEEIGAIEKSGTKFKAKDQIYKHHIDVHHVYKVALQRALEALQEPKDPTAYFDSFCLILSETEYEQIRQLLEETKTRMATIAGKKGPKARIAYYNTNLFWASKA